jgi:hypothetical protein
MKIMLIFFALIFSATSMSTDLKQLDEEYKKNTSKFLTSKKVNGLDIYNERKRLANKIIKLLDESNLKYRQDYYDKHLSKRNGIPLKEWHQAKIKFDNAWSGFTSNQNAVIYFLTQAYGTDGIAKIKKWVEANPFDYELWADRCQEPFCINAKGKTEYQITNHPSNRMIGKVYHLYYEE